MPQILMGGGRLGDSGPQGSRRQLSGSAPMLAGAGANPSPHKVGEGPRAQSPPANGPQYPGPLGMGMQAPLSLLLPSKHLGEYPRCVYLCISL